MYASCWGATGGGWSLLLTILFSLALSALTRAKVRLVTECKAGGMTDAEVEHEAEWVVHPMGKHPEELPRDPAAATLDVSCFRP